MQRENPPSAPAVPPCPAPGADLPAWPGSAELLTKNLSLLRTRSPAAARAVEQAGPLPEARLVRGPDGGLTGWLEGKQLASLRGPIVEGERWAQAVDVEASAIFAVRGLGLGHHVAALAQRAQQCSVVVVFEPDARLLRAVLERVDIGPWLEATNLAVVVGSGDRAELMGALAGLEGMVAGGVAILDHPPSKPRVAARGGEAFAQELITVVRGARVGVITTLLQTETTFRNLLGNVGHYTSCAGIADLAGVRTGKPAVVVSAGPSLHRNVELLAQPGVRDRVVIIAVQTVLKTLLARGIRPHFVTALDHAPISARFYEGLTPADVEGITLVVEPKANPAILRAFPGTIRCCADGWLDKLLGSELCRPMGSVPAGSTVAHLSYYLARHMGCDPVVLVGQDLGFPDGQYYAPGAAIHTVWQGELGEFNTLEGLEWQRIARMRNLCRRVTDQHGRPIYTDEQMSMYLVQFERDFASDTAKGLRVIDATEGGVAKLHTTIMPLGEALARFASQAQPPLPEAPAPQASPALRRRVEQRLAQLEEQAREARAICQRTVERMERMLALIQDVRRVNELVGLVQQDATRMVGMDAHWFIQALNPTGSLNRFKADRLLHLARGLGEHELRRRRIERDLANVRWLADASELAGELCRQALACARTGEPMPGPSEHGDDAGAAIASDTAHAGQAGAGTRVALHLHWDHRWTALGTPRPVGGHDGPDTQHPLVRTLARLARCASADAGVLLTTDDGRALRALLDAPEVRPVLPRSLEVVELDADQLASWRAWARAVAMARLWSRHAWRGGLGNSCAYDEGACARVLAPLLAPRRIDALALVGAEWSCVDPGLVDAIIVRWRGAGGRMPCTFSQAPVGLGCMVVSGAMLAELAGCPGVLGLVGSALGFHPLRAQLDPIGKAPCVGVSPAVRDLLLRVSEDDATWRALAASEAGLRHASDADMVARLAQRGLERGALVPEVLELDAADVDLDEVHAVAGAVARIGALQPALGVTLVDSGERPAPWRELAAALRGVGRAGGVAGVHLRTTHALLEREGQQALFDAMDLGLGVVSIELPGDSAEVWRTRSGSDSQEACWNALQAALDERARRFGQGLAGTWLVPRMARTDETVADVETFVDRWLLTCGACVLDPRAGVLAGERIVPLPVPEAARTRRERVTLRLARAQWARPAGQVGRAGALA